MLPSSWARQLVLATLVLVVLVALLWFAERVVSDPEDRGLSQTVAGVMFLVGFYAGGPLVARFLVPSPSGSAAMLDRVSAVLDQLPSRLRVVLYDHASQSASTVGILPKQSRIYVTSGLMHGVSDEGLKGVLAHEDTHIRELHVLVTLGYACTYACLAHLTSGDRAFVVGFLGFSALRRYLEYRADAGAARLVGASAMLTALRELQVMYPTRRWSRWFNFAAPYPTIPMRMKALETGRRPMI